MQINKTGANSKEGFNFLAVCLFAFCFSCQNKMLALVNQHIFRINMHLVCTGPSLTVCLGLVKLYK